MKPSGTRADPKSNVASSEVAAHSGNELMVAHSRNQNLWESIAANQAHLASLERALVILFPPSVMSRTCSTVLHPPLKVRYGTTQT